MRSLVAIRRHIKRITIKELTTVCKLTGLRLPGFLVKWGIENAANKHRFCLKFISQGTKWNVSSNRK